MELDVGQGVELRFDEGIYLSVRIGNLEDQNVEVLVISSAPDLTHPDPISAAIMAAAGADIQAQCDRIVASDGEVEVKEAVVDTSGGKLNVKKLIHAPTPRFEQEGCGNVEKTGVLLQIVYGLCLEKAKRSISIAFPTLGTGMHNIPGNVSATSGLQAVLDSFLSGELGNLRDIRFVADNVDVGRKFVQELQNILPLLEGRNPILQPLKLKNEASGSTSPLKKQKAGVLTRAQKRSMDNESAPEPEIAAEGEEEKVAENGNKNEEEEPRCAVCLLDFEDTTEMDVETLECGHPFHKDCIKETFAKMQPQCPICKRWFGVSEGNMPKGGKMNHRRLQGNVPGFNCTHYYEIYYQVPGGIQGPEHIRPGVPFRGAARNAYLPDTEEGRVILKLLELAFKQRLTFTVGDSHTSGAQNVVVWNCIHHKTSLHGGPQSYGFPDDKYLERLEQELAAVGITRDMLK